MVTTNPSTQPKPAAGKPHFLVVTLLILALVIAGCAPAATETAPPAPTQPPPTATSEPAEPTATAPAATETAPVPETGGTPAAETPEAASAAPLTFTLVEGSSQARYRVTEQLANRDLPNDAVGVTDRVSGSITILPDGSIDPASSQFVVDVSSLQTDNNMRDNYVRRNVLQTDQFPQVTFVPTAVSGLPSPLPASGPVQFQITGDLTIRDVTRPVTWDVTGSVDNGQASGTATTSFTFAEFNLPQPRVPIVLSLVDNITLELDVTLAGG